MQVGVDRVMTSRNLGSVMASMLAPEWKEEGESSNPALGASFAIFITP